MEKPPRIVSMRPVHEGWASFSIATIRLPDGREITREIEDHGRAVAVLPFDPVRKVCLLVIQPRFAAMVAGCETPFVEAPAGRLDEADPVDCARREALEECGVRLGALEHVVASWTMPGVSTERIDLYLAAYAESDRVTAGGGLAHEDEDIEVVEMPLAELAALTDAGRLVDMKTLVLALALRARRSDLFVA
jgi:nudix-type nucleoside diphosphatase (YffH/AdpP family)